MLAIFDFFGEDETGEQCLIDDIQAEFRFKPPGQLLEEPLLTNDGLFESALNFLIEHGVIELDEDDYGPPILTIGATLNALSASNLADKDLKTVQRYLKSRERKREWLEAALVNLKRDLRNREGPRSKDGEQIEAEESGADWSPLPLDREDAALKQIAQATDALLEEVRANNGYGVEYGEEKRLVVDSLESFSRTIKEEATISWIYIREFAIKPVEILIRRFGVAAIGITAEAAKAAIKEWLKRKGVTFLDGF